MEVTQRSLGRRAAPRHVGEESNGAEHFSLGQNTCLSLLTLHQLGSDGARARPEVRPSLPRKRREEAESLSGQKETEWRPLRLGVGSQCLILREPPQGHAAFGGPSQKPRRVGTAGEKGHISVGPATEAYWCVKNRYTNSLFLIPNFLCLCYPPPRGILSIPDDPDAIG